MVVRWEAKVQCNVWCLLTRLIFLERDIYQQDNTEDWNFYIREPNMCSRIVALYLRQVRPVRHRMFQLSTEMQDEKLKCETPCRKTAVFPLTNILPLIQPSDREVTDVGVTSSQLLIWSYHNNVFLKPPWPVWMWMCLSRPISAFVFYTSCVNPELYVVPI